eukprot:356660-Chlamydomonas_euryale.AAC.3
MRMCAYPHGCSPPRAPPPKSAATSNVLTLYATSLTAFCPAACPHVLVPRTAAEEYRNDMASYVTSLTAASEAKLREQPGSALVMDAAHTTKYLYWASSGAHTYEDQEEKARGKQRKAHTFKDLYWASSGAHTCEEQEGSGRKGSGNKGDCTPCHLLCFDHPHPPPCSVCPKPTPTPLSPFPPPTKTKTTAAATIETTTTTTTTRHIPHCISSPAPKNSDFCLTTPPPSSCLRAFMFSASKLPLATFSSCSKHACLLLLVFLPPLSYSFPSRLSHLLPSLPPRPLLHLRPQPFWHFSLTNTHLPSSHTHTQFYTQFS